MLTRYRGPGGDGEDGAGLVLEAGENGCARPGVALGGGAAGDGAGAPCAIASPATVSATADAATHAIVIPLVSINYPNPSSLFIDASSAGVNGYRSKSLLVTHLNACTLRAAGVPMMMRHSYRNRSTT